MCWILCCDLKSCQGWILGPSQQAQVQQLEMLGAGTEWRLRMIFVEFMAGNGACNRSMLRSCIHATMRSCVFASVILAHFDREVDQIFGLGFHFQKGWRISHISRFLLIVPSSP